MRVIFANTFDTRGGAARAAFRLFSGVYDLDNCDAHMIVQDRQSDHLGVSSPRFKLPAHWTSWMDLRKLKKDHPERERTPYSVNWVPGFTISTIRGMQPDLVHMHWPHCGFIRIEDLRKLDVPIVWTIHDMWAFTGVCHYSPDCEGYLTGCGKCPLLKSGDGDDISARTYRRKDSVYPELDMTVVSPSNWLADLARKSPLLRNASVKVIPNGISTDLFCPGDKADSRHELGLPQDTPLLMFGADFALSDHRKGSGQLFEALSIGPLGDFEIAVFGCDQPPVSPALPMKVHWLGPINNDARLASAYSAADLFVAPSQQENLSNTVMEALACGTAVLAYDVGGMGDLVDDGENGFLVSLSEESNGLRKGLEAAAHDLPRLGEMGKAARESVLSRFRIGDIARKYAELYHTCLDS
ncbi:MAG: glycosyltransferase [Pseudodesulfovibrio sp.]